MRQGKLSNRSSQIVLVSFFLSFLTLSAPVLGAVTVGVHTGDWVQYGNFTGSAKSDFNQTSWLKGTVQTISGTTVTVQALAHYANGTEKTQTLTGDIATGSGNVSFILIPSGLNKGDTFMLNGGPAGGSTMTVTINGTSTRTYLGASRTVDQYTYSYSYSSSGINAAYNFTAYWDQATGVLVEIAFSYVISGNCFSYCSNNSFGFSVTQTSLWGGGIFGGSSSSNLLLYGGIVVVVIVVAAGGYFYMHSRKPKVAPPMTPGTPTGTS